MIGCDSAKDVLRAAGPMAYGTVSSQARRGAGAGNGFLEIVTWPARLLSRLTQYGNYRQRHFVDPADAGYGFVD